MRLSPELEEEWTHRWQEIARLAPTPLWNFPRIDSPTPARCRDGTPPHRGSRFISPHHPRARRESARDLPEEPRRSMSRRQRLQIEASRSLPPGVPIESPAGVAPGPTRPGQFPSPGRDPPSTHVPGLEVGSGGEPHPPRQERVTEAAPAPTAGEPWRQHPCPADTLESSWPLGNGSCPRPSRHVAPFQVYK